VYTEIAFPADNYVTATSCLFIIRLLCLVVQTQSAHTAGSIVIHVSTYEAFPTTSSHRDQKVRAGVFSRIAVSSKGACSPW